MNNIITDITQNLIRKLPENKKYFTPDELIEYGIPDFVVNRLNLALEENLRDELSMPETDWANTQADEVIHAWDDFLEELSDNRWLPEKYLSPAFENIVEELLSILVNPRKNIPDVIYGRDTKLTTSVIEKRLRNIVVYRHFAQALQRFIHKKELQEMTRDYCESVIRQIDQKLSEKYTPVSWLQVLSPWFVLMGNHIQSDLLRQFFEEKGLNNWAGQFKSEDTYIDGDRILHVLSDSKDTESVPKQKNDLFKNFENKNHTSKPDETNQESKKETTYNNDIENIWKRYGYRDFRKDEDEMESVHPDDQTDDQDKSHNDEKLEEPRQNQERQSEPKQSEKPEPQEKNEKPVNENGKVDSDPDPDDNGEVPIWKRFVKNGKDDDSLISNLSNKEDKDSTNDDFKDDQEESESRTLADILAEKAERDYPLNNIQETGENEDDNEEEGYVYTPIPDWYANESTEADKKYEDLNTYIGSQKDYFVNNLFGGDEQSYKMALRDVTKFSKWKDASQYISKEIFRRNMIDIYTEVAIDFTDTLQTFFTHYNNSDTNH